MLLYLSVTAENELFARRHCRELAHMNYRIDANGHLACCGRSKNGLMVLSDEGAPDFSDRKTLAAELLRECRAGAFSGIVADFERPPTEERLHFLKLLGDNLRYVGKRFFVPLSYAACCKSAFVLFPTALSGGCYAEQLKQCARLVGVKRIALDLQWLRMDFPLPCPTGEGKPLSGDELRRLAEKHKPAQFYSKPLAAAYFSYQSGQEHRFVLYDTPATLAEKLRFAASIGCETAFIMVSETENELGTLLQLFKQQKLI